MIKKETVTELVNQWLEGKEYYLVDVSVSPENSIVVEIDHANGVWIEDCAELSRYIESNLDRDKEDYELEVGSAGIGQPFKIPQQYVSHIDKEVEVMYEGKKIRGIMKSVDGNSFTIVTKEKHKEEGKKKAVTVDVDRTFKMDEVKYTKYLISFK